MSAVPILGVDVSKVATSLNVTGEPGAGFAVGQTYRAEGGNEYVLCSTASNIDASAGAEPVSISADGFVVAASGATGTVFGWLADGQDTVDTTVRYVWVQTKGAVIAGAGSADSTAIQTVGGFVNRLLSGSVLVAAATTSEKYAVTTDDTAGAEVIYIF